ncbi:hypothetical protein EXIGLDRAFT_770654 [Exidia glandulosa HHB12029]|uniref:C2H2-type domain-containing protein n=1 Tax=Exidia glandulosa HHB12029 TaxID=1314781 RepID=A0A166ACE9_EXIGL|nr:hypothetical protein EXIGLDRAFT_770654 [Exidia glandulosa HHB12029]
MAESVVVSTVQLILSKLDDADKDVAASAVLVGYDDAYAVLKKVADGGEISNNLLNVLAPLVRSWVDHGLFIRKTHDVAANVEDATRAVSAVFSSSAPTASAVHAVQHQMHQLFLFAVTAAPAAGPTHAPLLHALGGVLHFVGALHQLQLAPPPAAAPHLQPPVPDIGTAVFRCAAPGCGKLFTRLFFLQAHARLHGPPTLACSQCAETFSRGADLNKHLDAHSFRCAGCNGVFPSRDVIEDHQSGEDSEECKDADIEERTPEPLDHSVEEGEILADSFGRAIQSVIPLQTTLQTYAAQAVASGAAVLETGPSPKPGHTRAARAATRDRSISTSVPAASATPAAAAVVTPAPPTPVPAPAIAAQLPPPTPAPEPTPTPAPAPALSESELVAQALAAAMAQAEAELMEDYGDEEYAEGEGGGEEEYYDEDEDAEGEIDPDAMLDDA